VSYFFKKAQEKSDDSEVQDLSFRYPGPKPQTKETGIVMLADAVEASARSLRDPSVGRLRNMVSKIVADRFTSGELDECPLTLRDLNQIKISFERTLTGLFHGRISYADEQKPGSLRLETQKDKRAVPATPVSTLHTPEDLSAESSASV